MTTNPSQHVATYPADHAARRADTPLTTATAQCWTGGRYVGSRPTRHLPPPIVQVHATLREGSRVPRYRICALTSRQPLLPESANLYFLGRKPQPQPRLHPQRDQDYNARQQALQQTGTILQMRRQGNTAAHTNRLQQRRRKQRLQGRKRRQQDAERKRQQRGQKWQHNQHYPHGTSVNTTAVTLILTKPQWYCMKKHAPTNSKSTPTRSKQPCLPQQRDRRSGQSKHHHHYHREARHRQ